MKYAAVIVCFVVIGANSTIVAAGGPHRCHACYADAAGAETPCGDTGCGPRYRGEIHEPSRCDPCDACNRWRGCNGVVQGPEVLAPWQLPPGRGFMSAEQVGYATWHACRTCRR